MTAPVRIEAEAWSDLRFTTLARLLGLADLEHALIKTARIWSWQTEHYTPERPTYVVDSEIAESALGPGGAAARVRARLAEEVPDGLRIHGSVGRIEWLWRLRQKSRAGGEATKRKHNNKHEPASSPEAKPRGPAEGPPVPGPLIPALVPVLLEEHPPAHAIPHAGLSPDSTRAAVTELPDGRPTTAERAAVRERLRAELGAARSRAARSRGVNVKPLLAFDHGLDVDLAGLLSQQRTRSALAMLEEQALHAIAMAEIQVTNGAESFQWFTGTIFSGGNFARFAGTTEDDARRARGAPRSDAPRASGRVEPLPPAKYASGDVKL
jgi:hypothetical protein